MPHSSLSDEELIAKLRQSDIVEPDAKFLSVLVERHQDRMVRKCYYYVKDSETARDLSQEVWIRVLTKLHQFRPQAPFIPWLFGIVHNRCHDHIQQNKRLLHQEISQKIVNSLEDELDTEHVDKPTIEILEELMEKISGEDKLLLLLKYKHRWTAKAIAQSLSISEDNVKKRLSRSRQKLQMLLSKYGGHHL